MAMVVVAVAARQEGEPLLHQGGQVEGRRGLSLKRVACHNTVLPSKLHVLNFANDCNTNS